MDTQHTIETRLLRRSALVIAMSLAGVALASDAHAYQLESALFGNVRWQNNWATFELVNATFAAGDVTAINTARNLWNASSANFQINTVNGDGGFGYPNGENEIARTTDHWLVPPGTGMCQKWFDPVTGNIIEVDIMFDNHPDNTHTTSKGNMWAYGGAWRPLSTLMMHEFGHGIGLKHEADVYNVMGHDWKMLHSNGSSVTPFVGSDAVMGAIALYGSTANPGHDIAAVHWRRTGASGEYSVHTRTRVFSTNGAVRPKKGGTEPVYHVQAGNSYKVEFTFENLRSSMTAVTTRYRLSTNNYLSSADTLLATTISLFFPMMSAKMIQTVTIPSDVTGNRWVGPVVQVDGASELSTSNNATYTGLYVVPASAGGWSWCSPGSPCGWGEGDCDTNNDCAGSLTCAYNVGAKYGWDPDLDVCE